MREQVETSKDRKPGVIASLVARPLPFALVACCFGLLLWARLILVTSHPRTAIAEPAAQQDERASPDAADAPVDDAHTSETPRRLWR